MGLVDHFTAADTIVMLRGLCVVIIVIDSVSHVVCVLCVMTIMAHG